jgi:serpin B
MTMTRFLVGGGTAASRRRINLMRGTGVLLAAAIAVGACSTATATPTGTAVPTTQPTNTTAPSAWPSASNATTPDSSPTNPPTSFDQARGKAPLLAPAEEGGVRAGGEINEFAFDLLRRLEAKGNLCASPSSIAVALAMVRPGARGTTASEMDKVLHGFGSPEQAREVVALLNVFQSQNASDETGQRVVEMNVSNAVFSQKGMNLVPAYLDAMSSEFGAGIGLLDYIRDPEGARAIINHWADVQTKGRIPNVLQPGDIDTDTRIALANAIYLKAGWLDPFDPSMTKPLPFTTGTGSTVSVPTMTTERLLSYASGSGYRAVDLRLGSYPASLAMTFIVPDDMTSFVAGLNASKLAAIDARKKTSIVDLSLPKFSAETRTDLAAILAAMGMPTAFGDADLSGVTTDEKLQLAKVIHQANIDVVEEGVTAAAVTVVTGRATSGGEVPPRVTLHVDKPFLYFIRETTTGTILFMGRIDDPSITR